MGQLPGKSSTVRRTDEGRKDPAGAAPGAQQDPREAGEFEQLTALGKNVSSRPDICPVPPSPTPTQTHILTHF